MSKDEPLPFGEYLFINRRTGESEWDEVRFHLMWLEHGGSGLGMQFSEVNELDYLQIVRLAELKEEQRKREADAMKNAARRSSAR